MNLDQPAYSQIAKTLARHFDSMYYVDIESGRYIEVKPSSLLARLNIPGEGDDFFAIPQENAHKVVHPDDIEMINKIHDRDTIIKNVSKTGSYAVPCRLVLDGQIVHIRHIDILSEDKKHLILCLENVEEEFQEKVEQEENLQSAKRSARRDELTGIKNKTAYAEETAAINERIRSGDKDLVFSVVMCDINDLKKINDTRGHSFGDESIQHTSRMICDVFKHSPVFRIGGDEFTAILSGYDYEQREFLLQILKDESLANKKSRSGPTVAFGMSDFDPEKDKSFEEVFKRADALMYENKSELKAEPVVKSFRKMDHINRPITDERKRLLDGLFGAFLTISGGGYIYLNDMKYDFSRWSLSLIDDFGLDSEYMYHADTIWLDHIHPDDLEIYREAVDAVLRGTAELRHICYRARKADGSYVLLTTRGFVLSDKKGNPEYFGGIIIPQ